MKRAPYGRKRLNLPKLLAVVVVVAAVGFGFKMWADAASPATSKMAAKTPQLRNEVREESLKQISEAISRYQAEVGAIPVKVSSAPTGICSGATNFCKKYGRFDPAFLISSGYLNSVPNDPVGGRDLFSTGYTIMRDASGAVTLAAPRAEEGATIVEVVR